jgi:glycosyltransferase involved in cell wall biosynthesis
METVPPPTALKYAPNAICKLLFIGVEWERKGGQIALDALHALQRSGIPAALTIVGCMPPGYATGHFGIPALPSYPLLINTYAIEVSRLNDLLRNSDFLLLPTRAECAGIVFCEASAYGIPVITTLTGALVPM